VTTWIASIFIAGVIGANKGTLIVGSFLDVVFGSIGTLIVVFYI